MGRRVIKKKILNLKTNIFNEVKMFDCLEFLEEELVRLHRLRNRIMHSHFD